MGTMKINVIAPNGAPYIRCICDNFEIQHNDDVHGKLIQCDQCSNFQHLVCMGFDEDPDPPWDVRKANGARYFCDRCKPHDHQATIGAAMAGNSMLGTTRYIAWNLHTRAKAVSAKREILYAVKTLDAVELWMTRERNRAAIEEREAMSRRDTINVVESALGKVFEIMSNVAIVKLEKDLRFCTNMADWAKNLDSMRKRYRSGLSTDDRAFLDQAFKVE